MLRCSPCLVCRFVLFSYPLKHSDGRASFPLCFIFSSPRWEQQAFILSPSWGGTVFMGYTVYISVWRPYLLCPLPENIFSSRSPVSCFPLLTSVFPLSVLFLFFFQIILLFLVLFLWFSHLMTPVDIFSPRGGIFRIIYIYTFILLNYACCLVGTGKLH
jgi:hypothetical protein